jgi:hypothetical protein
MMMLLGGLYLVINVISDDDDPLHVRDEPAVAGKKRASRVCVVVSSGDDALMFGEGIESHDEDFGEGLIFNSDPGEMGSTGTVAQAPGSQDPVVWSQASQANPSKVQGAEAGTASSPVPAPSSRVRKGVFPKAPARVHDPQSVFRRSPGDTLLLRDRKVVHHRPDTGSVRAALSRKAMHWRRFTYAGGRNTGNRP